MSYLSCSQPAPWGCDGIEMFRVRVVEGAVQIHARLTAIAHQTVVTAATCRTISMSSCVLVIVQVLHLLLSEPVSLTLCPGVVTVRDLLLIDAVQALVCTVQEAHLAEVSWTVAGSSGGGDGHFKATALAQFSLVFSL